jgi:hypothetical protein
MPTRCFTRNNFWNPKKIITKIIVKILEIPKIITKILEIPKIITKILESQKIITKISGIPKKNWHVPYQ